MNSADHLVLGTAQLGMPYGVANCIGKPDPVQAMRIIDAAWTGGIRLFDTAQAYGESESTLGRCLESLGISTQARVISKLDPKLNLLDPVAVRCAVEASLRRLGVRSLYGLMLHREESLDLWGDGLHKVLTNLLEEGLIEKVGASVYTPERALRALEMDGIDILQIPANPLDHRFANAGVFDHAVSRQKQLFVRSAFLQGLLLLKPEEIPGHLESARPYVARFQELASSFQISAPQAALSYLRCAFPSALILFGAETEGQVKANLAISQSECPVALARAIKTEFGPINEPWLNPASWSNQ